MPENINLTSLGKASWTGGAGVSNWHENQAQAAIELVKDGSVEFSIGSPDQVSLAVDLLPYGTPVFVPVLPLHDMRQRIEIIHALHATGFDPVPHIAARRIPDRGALAEFLSETCGSAGVHRVLVIGGDSDSVSGPWTDSVALLRDGVLAEAGIKEISLAGYPEGHPGIAAAVMRAALLEKLDVLREQGLGAEVVTQFSFVPSRIIEYCSSLAREEPDVPVYVGMPGPASLRQLVHFARYCGVSASLSAVAKVGVKLAQLAGQGNADAQLGALASFNASHPTSNIVGVHLFSFGGFLETARWMNGHLNPV